VVLFPNIHGEEGGIPETASDTASGARLTWAALDLVVGMGEAPDEVRQRVYDAQRAVKALELLTGMLESARGAAERSDHPRALWHALWLLRGATPPRLHLHPGSKERDWELAVRMCVAELRAAQRRVDHALAALRQACAAADVGRRENRGG
jgi:hypothetical protein